MKVPSSCDIFCVVIDNYGDIGVSWRLARQLSAEYGIAVRLWVDKLAALQRIWPPMDAERAIQRISIEGGVEVEVREWTSTWSPVEPADVAIEAFGCQLPVEYVHAMVARVPQSLWINLEYLSAEDWVADCHGLSSPQSLPLLAGQPSSPLIPQAASQAIPRLTSQLTPQLTPQPQGNLSKYFFFPGFTADTGGLLRERDLLQRGQAFQADPGARDDFLARCGLGELVSDVREASAAPALLVSLFAYEDAPLRGLFDAWSKSNGPIVCLVPEGRLLDAVGRFFGAARPEVGTLFRQGALTVGILPFLAQDEYDRLLWSCDINFVRGEDSFVRAQWAARPFIWHIYPQEDEAHLVKLQAFLDRYRATLSPDAGAALAGFWRAWNGKGEIGAAWHALIPWLPALRAAAPAWPAEQASRGNLAAALVQFCANHV